MSDYKNYFIDLDGTIYQGKIKYPSGKRFIDRLRAKDIPYLFVTNNSTKSPLAVAKNLSENHNIPTTPFQIYTSAMATADYLKNILPKQAKIYIIGELGLIEALSAANFDVVDSTSADAVIVGLDRQITYDKMAQATIAIQNGAKFIATNTDTNLPTENGMMPGAGALVAAIQTATNVAPTIIAKPASPIMLGALNYMKATKDETIMVGDNYHTDILAGINNGIDTLLVYSGVSTKDQIAKLAKKPTYEVDSLDDWSI